MSNVIQIKHGTGNPAGKLQPYELGYSDDGCLYIGTDKNTAAKLSNPKTIELVNSNNYLVLPTITNAGSDTDKFLVCDNNGWVKFRTGADILSDIGAFPASGGVLITTEGNWGEVDPNTINKKGTPGQLYFVLI